MRGESSDVIEGEAVEVIGGLSGKSTTTSHSPPLSAAASQVSLATSDLTTSDPDLAVESSASSFTSSRPPSSSDVISLDLGLPNADDDTIENVMSTDLGVTSVADYTTENLSSDQGVTSIENVSDMGVTSVDDSKTENVSSNPEVTSIENVSSDLGITSIEDSKTENISPNLRAIRIDDYQTENIISPDPGITDGDDYTIENDFSSELGLPSLPDNYTTETVDCPESPLPQTEEGQKTTGVKFAPDIKINATASIESNKVVDEESTEDASEDNNRETGIKLLGVPPEDGPPSLGPPEGPPSLGFDVEMEDEDYFEEFHLPNTYDNAFVRHKSFRRKVNLSPIDAPDAERIEGLIVAGEFERHGSIRRKLVPEVIPDENKNKLENRLSDISSKSGSSENDGTDVSISSDVVGVFARDLEEIQEMLNEETNENIEEDVEPINNLDSVNHNKALPDDISSVTSSDMHEVSKIQDYSELSEETENELGSKQPIKRTNTSTPKSNSTSSYTSAMLDKDLSSMSEGGDTSDKKGDEFLSFEENMSIEHSTLLKIQECRDFSKYKDMYNLTGRIQDLLSPEEMKEVVENVDRYKEYINQDIIDVLNHSLSLSLQEQSIENNTDSGISSPKRTSSDIKSDLRSVFEGSNGTVDEGNENESNESSHEINENDSKENINNYENTNAGFVFERKHSLRIVKSNTDNEADEVEVEAVFVESNNSPRNMKRLTAPAMDFSTGSEDLDGSHDISVFSNESPLTDLNTPYLPNIVLINTDGYRGDIKQNDDSHASLLLYDTPSAASEVLTPLDIGPHSFTVPPDPDRPGSADSNGGGGQRKLICVTKDILNSPGEEDNISISSVCSEGFTHEDTLGSIGDEILGISGNSGINSPRRSHGSDGCLHSSPDSNSFEEPPLPPSPYKTKGEGPIPSLPPFIPELTAMEESMEDRHWRSVVVGGSWRRIDMKVIAPYRKCLHHGGYMSENNLAIIVFSSCYLPSSSRRDYNYVMDNLFLYVLSTLEQLIADDYVLIYLAGGCPKTSVPSFKWLKRAYQMIDRKLRKNLQALHVVHPTMWVKTIVTLTRPFVSSKFYRKLSFINNLTELAQVVPLDQLEIPDTVQQHDGTRKPSILTLLTGSNPPPGRTLS